MLLSRDQEVIIAHCTPQGSGSLALLRISGTQALTVAANISKLANGQQLHEQSTHTVHMGYVVEHNGQPIDQVMFILLHAPRTFTGQDTVEITCHNNPFIIQAIIDRAILAGARLAQPGEFAKRAVLNKKIDVMQAEAIHELITANTQQALKQSLAQVQGSFSAWIANLERDLIKILALSEASFEFLDEEMEFGTTITALLEQVMAHIGSIKKTFNQQQHIRSGIRIALIGAVNAGKSSLFNALLGQQRAIVTNIAGTTRDAIEAGIYKQDSYWTLIDTAGLRQTDDVIEQEGIATSWRQAAQADIIVLVIDQSRIMTAQERMVYEQLLAQYPTKIIIVHTKADEPNYPNEPLSKAHDLQISSTQRTNLDTLEQLLHTKAMQLCAQADAPFLLNQRHYTILLALEQKLTTVHAMLKGPVEYELLSYHINDALAQLTQLTGKTISEQGMDAVFREFCVGK